MILGMSVEHWFSCFFIILGITLLYFGFFRSHWFSKKYQKPSFRDDSYFWHVFPYGLFFLVGGIAFHSQPTPGSLLLAFGCAAWVKIVYKIVQ
ncbi:MAG: hypothetical protein ACXWRE_15530 [Pseudobdellovibrionaceae bacterium]